MSGRLPGGLVGRAAPLGLLGRAVERAADERPTVVVLSGETGIGKTRLVTELVRERDLLVLAGTCVPVGGAALPFAPLTQALRTASHDPLCAREIERSPDLLRLLPPGPGSDAATGPDPEDERAPSSALRLFQSVLALLDRLGLGQVVVHVVEDLQWADPSTLDLLRYLATNLTTERVLLLLTYRDDEVAEGSDLTHWLAELHRLPLTQKLHLDRLTPAETAALVAELRGGPPPPDILEAVIGRSAGNPLFVEQLARHDSAAGLPATLGDLLRSRVAAVPPDSRVVLRGAAVLGRSASITLLADTVGRPVEEVEDLLRPMLDQHLLELRPDETVGFSHPALREVVYAGVLPSQRTRLHLAAAAALSDDDTTGEAARHWHLGGDLTRALVASVQAGYAAERIYAFADAHSSFVRALDLLDQVPETGAREEVDRVDLLKHAAETASMTGDHAAAVRLTEVAIGSSTDRAVRARLYERLGSFHFLAGAQPEAETALRESLRLLGDEPSTLAARVHAMLGQLWAAWSRFDEAAEACEQALRMARSSGARREEGVALNARGVVRASRGDLDGGVADLEQALRIAEELADPDDLGAAYVNLSHVLGLAHRVDDVARVGREGIDVLTRVGMVRQDGSLLRANVAESLLRAGRFTEADDVLTEALAHHPRGIVAAPALLQSGRLALLRGELQVAWERCEQARTVLESESAPDGWQRLVGETAAEVELWAGRPQAAYDLVTDALAAIEGSDEESFGAGLVVLGLRAVADEHLLRRDAATRERARRWALELEQRAEGVLPGLADVESDGESDGESGGESDGESGGVPPGETSAVALPDLAAFTAWGRAELARYRGAPSAEAWQVTVETWTRLDRPVDAAYALWRLAEARLAAGAGVEAVAAVRGAHTEAVRLGMMRLGSEVQNLARWYRVDLVDMAEPEVRTGLEELGLTARETEVLEGLAEGRTNKEIAEALFISVKTASVHVSNILRKLDVDGRQDAARIAHRLQERGSTTGAPTSTPS